MLKTLIRGLDLQISSKTSKKFGRDEAWKYRLKVGTFLEWIQKYT